MPIENSLRNTLRLTITSCRRLLEEDYRLQLEGHYGIRTDGNLEPLSGLQHLNARGRAERRSIEAALRHETIQEKELSLAIERFVRESAFTALNRLAALKLMEHPTRGLIVESIGQKELSKGFRQFVMISPEALRDKADGGYRLYLELLLDDLGQTLGALFDRSLPQSILFPSPTCLSQVLNLLNQPELAPVWGDDETIGWIYQYFTPPELRDQARKESSAPRNSNELAFRNQFYTPRYVVEFLVDNTLGRTWYEMRQGSTTLVETCQYLIHRKHPVFLSPGEEPPKPYDPDKDRHGDPDLRGEMWTRPNPEIDGIGAIFWYALSVGGYDYAREHLGVECGDLANQRLRQYQEKGKWEGSFEELRCCLFFEQRRYHHFGRGPEGAAGEAIQAVYRAICEQWDLEVEFIPYRAKRDPRTLRILDPACGSGHFLLYAFDLLETIYLEAYDDPDLGPQLQAEYPDQATYKQAIPALILKHNLHGIDIDLRAAQIAALALWLRAQRSFTMLKIPARQRPKTLQPQIVCAEPMPGEYDLLGEFLRDLQPAILGNLVREIWERMEGADEIGSLLKIEQEIRSAIQKARKAWLSMPDGVQLSLFGDRPAAVQLKMDLAEIKDEAFWDHVEEDVLEALEHYTRWASGVDGVTRHLFAHDAAQGFAFVDLLQRPFDVVLMNPPFGAPSLGSKEYIVKNYPRTKNDLYAAFVERGLELLRTGGYLGAITSRTGFFLKSFQKWREEILLKEAQVLAFADLGYGVLDTAMVETAAYVIQKTLPVEK
jgi:hypothetical protein